MYRYVLFVVIFFLLAPILMARPRSERTTRLAAVVHVYSRTGSCSGFVVKRNVVATAKHCLDSSDIRTVEFADGRREEFVPAYVSKNLDFTLLLVDTKQIEPFRLDPRPNHTLHQVNQIGYTDGGPDQLITPGLVVGRFGERLITTAMAIKGDSGGVVLNHDNSAIGLICQTFFPAPGTEAVAIQAVIKALTELP